MYPRMISISVGLKHLMVTSEDMQAAAKAWLMGQALLTILQ